MTDTILRRAEEIGTGNAAEVAYRLPITGDTRTKRGRLRGALGGQLLIEVAGDLKRIDFDRIRYLSPLDEMLNCANYYEGQRVRFRKYGSVYVGTVVSTAKTRLTVKFKTRGDERAGRQGREMTIPAIEVERVERTTNY